MTPRPGDVLLTADTSFLSTLIRGFPEWAWRRNPDGVRWSHAGILVEGGERWLSLEVAPPVCSLQGPEYYDGRYVQILRPPLPDGHAEKAAAAARKIVGKRYPIGELFGYALFRRFRRWMAGTDERVCSGQVGWCLAVVGLEWQDDMREPLDFETELDPSGIARQARRDGWEVVWEQFS